VAYAKILIVDDEPAIRQLLKLALLRSGHQVTECADGGEASNALEGGTFDLVISDLTMPIADGLAVLRKARTVAPGTPVVILTARAAISDCVEAMREGAFNFLVKPFHPTELAAVVAQALRAGQAAQSAVPAARPSGGEQAQAALIGESPALRQVLDVVGRVAPSEATVLLLGESGTGKEVVARLLHSFSPRVGGPFIAVNCGAIPEGLLESELFGHTKGAFTGATENRPGKFIEADGGTLFLDEVGELPLASQVKLLRVLQDRTVTPVGDGKSRTVQTRVVAATNQDLETRVKEGRFRTDLYYRLNVVPILLPALRERGSDVPLLARHFLASANRRAGKNVVLSEGALAALALGAWPGNVRELENMIERLVILDRTGVVRAEDVPASVTTAAAKLAGAAAQALANGGIDLVETMARIEGVLIESALRAADGNKSRAAELLSLSRTTLLDKLKRSAS
jgi:two-component system response regulator AtoC